ncbi:hypothetical protein LUW76_33825 [Actinomadura madurae]|uniref:hypothetical protein n=1 Tax=Actinomadura madurae TaxID=1993 RepID=UPI0020261290|nr:hypothetical protein [Actinomadura madurae]URM98914.1 hypothetical protein LUW76_33825 [Actinomadura madurae]URN09605.1 hypothetical protein LUW74_43825 [Actinomadura madurae]
MGVHDTQDTDAERGPAMLAATNMLKPPPAVIGSLNEDITLPRTVRLTTALAVVAGAILGFLSAITISGAGVRALVYGIVLGGAAGWTAVNTSPLRGESLLMWLGLHAGNARKRKVVLNGRSTRLYVGIAPLTRTAAGRVRVLPGGVPVDAASWDARGIPRQEIPGTSRLGSRPGRRASRGPGSAGRSRLTASAQVSSQGLRARRARRRPVRRT